MTHVKGGQRLEQRRIVDLETAVEALQTRVSDVEERCRRMSALLEAAESAKAGSPQAAPAAGGLPADREMGESTVRARAGDRLIIKGHRVGEPDRDGEILEVHGPGGSPPFLVRWSEDGHVGLLIPGSDAAIQHLSADDAERSA